MNSTIKSSSQETRDIPFSGKKLRNSKPSQNSVSLSNYKIQNILFSFFKTFFTRPINSWLVLLCIIQLIFTFDTRKFLWTTLLPLGILFGLSVIKEVIELLAKYQHDVGVDYTLCKIWDGQSIKEINTCDLSVGDFIIVNQKQSVPADLILLCVSSPDGKCFVDTSSILDDRGLMTKYPVDSLKYQLSFTSFSDVVHKLKSIKGTATVPKPNADFSSFEAKIKLKVSPAASHVRMKNLLIRDSVLINCEWALGLVVYVGNESKTWVDSCNKAKKSSKSETKLNILTLTILTGIILISSISVILSKYAGQNENFDKVSQNFFHFLLLYSIAAPAPLFIVLDLVKIVKVLALFRNFKVLMRNLNLLEDFGNVEYVLTDKTGTVTENEISVNMCLLKNLYYKNVEDLNEKEMTPNQSFDDGKEGFRDKDHFVMCMACCNKAYTCDYGESYLTKSADERVLINTAVILGVKLIKRSQKELVVLRKGEEIEFEVLGGQSMSETRKKGHIVLKYQACYILYMIGSFEAIDESLHFSQTADLDILEITNSNKKQGIRQLILAYKTLSQSEVDCFRLAYSNASRSPINKQGRIESLFDELGSDSTYLGLIGLEESIDPYTKSTIQTLLSQNIKFWLLSGDSFESSLSAGISSGIIDDSIPVVSIHNIRSEDEFFQITDTILDKYISPSVPLMNPNVRRSSLSIFQEPIACFVSEKNSFIPREKDEYKEDLTLCGNSAITSSQPFKIMTSDEINSKRSLNSSLSLGLARGKLIHPLVKKLTNNVKPNKQMTISDAVCRFTLFIDARSLEFALKNEENLRNLVILIFKANSVIFTSVLPSHKTIVAGILRRNFKEEPLILAIGDGGSDVGMIQLANIGCGIANNRGNQAASASDVVINDFSDLKYLILDLGKTFNQNLIKSTWSIFYSMTCLVFMEFWINLLSDFSGPVYIPFQWYIFYYLIIGVLLPFALCLVSSPAGISIKPDTSEETSIAPGPIHFNQAIHSFNLCGKTFTSMPTAVSAVGGLILSIVQSGFLIWAVRFGLSESISEDSACISLLIFLSLIITVLFTTCLFLFQHNMKSPIIALIVLVLTVTMIVIDSQTNVNSSIYHVLEIYSQVPALVFHVFLITLFNCQVPLFILFWVKIFRVFKVQKKSIRRINKNKRKSMDSIFKLKGDEFEKCSKNGGEFSRLTLKFESSERNLKHCQSVLGYRIKSLYQISFIVIPFCIILLIVSLVEIEASTSSIVFYCVLLFIFGATFVVSRFYYSKSYLNLSKDFKVKNLIQVLYLAVNLLVLVFSFFENLFPVVSFLYPSSLLMLFTDDWVFVLLSSCFVTVSLFRSSIAHILENSDYYDPGMNIIQFVAIYLASAILCLVLTYKLKFQCLTQFNELQLMSDEYEKGTCVLDFLLPAFVRKRVKDGARYIAEAQGEVSVLFCYIVNFDKITNEYSIEELTGLLDEIFGKIDSLCEMIGVSKIETVANTYMACAGLKDGDSELKPSLRSIPHARRSIELAFAILRASNQILLKNGERITLKVGIHSGTVTAGVVGYHKPQFSLVGDTVNTASRMASSAEKNSIHISMKTFELIAEPKGFAFKANKIEVKGKGLMETFTVYLNQMRQEPEFENRISWSYSSMASNQGVSMKDDEEEVNDEKRDLIQDLRAVNGTEILRNASGKKKLEAWARFRLAEDEWEFVRWNLREFVKVNAVVGAVKMALSLVLLATLVKGHGGEFREVLIAAQTVEVVLVLGLGFFYRYYCTHYVFVLVMIGCLVVSTVLSTAVYIFVNSTDILLIYTLLHIQILFQFTPLLYCQLFLPQLLLLLYLFLSVLLSSTYQSSLAIFLPSILYFHLIQCLQKHSTESRTLIHKSLSTIASAEYTKITKLLTQMIPEHVFNHLKDENTVTDNFVQVTVIYADIVGFTPWSSGREPEEIVNMLSSLFTKFDKSSVKHNVYKVHTIGDCYVAMGVNSGQARDPVDECINVVMFAYSMIKIIKKVQKMNHELNMRIGIHTGDIIGGVMGTSIVRYDIYGTDVLFANSMESCGIPGKIIVSESTKNFLEKGMPKKFKYKFHTEVKILERTCKAFELVKVEEVQME